MNILLVEDEDNLRSKIAFFLEMKAYDVRTATDGIDACEQLNDYTPDLVITDLKMPRMNGLELLKYIRNSDHPTIPTIVISASFAHEWVREVETLGLSTYLMKPFDLDALINAIEKVAVKAD